VWWGGGSCSYGTPAGNSRLEWAVAGRPCSNTRYGPCRNLFSAETVCVLYLVCFSCMYIITLALFLAVTTLRWQNGYIANSTAAHYRQTFSVHVFTSLYGRDRSLRLNDPKPNSMYLVDSKSTNNTCTLHMFKSNAERVYTGLGTVDIILDRRGC